jgi:hypothetical protein
MLPKLFRHAGVFLGIEQDLEFDTIDTPDRIFLCSLYERDGGWADDEFDYTGLDGWIAGEEKGTGVTGDRTSREQGA